MLAGAYGYNLLCIRWLGPRDYGDVAALTALSTIVLLPLLGVQVALAREVSTYRAHGNERAIAALLRLTLRRTLIFGGAAALALIGLAPVISSLLDISETASTVSAVVLTFAGSFFPLLQAFPQGSSDSDESPSRLRSMGYAVPSSQFRSCWPVSVLRARLRPAPCRHSLQP